jgi:hypothetical protein
MNAVYEANPIRFSADSEIDAEQLAHFLDMVAAKYTGNYMARR